MNNVRVTILLVALRAKYIRLAGIMSIMSDKTNYELISSGKIKSQKATILMANQKEKSLTVMGQAKYMEIQGCIKSCSPVRNQTSKNSSIFFRTRLEFKIFPKFG